MQQIADWREAIATNPDSLACFNQYRIGEADISSTGECFGYGFFINNIFGIYETAYFDRQYGFIGESEWLRMSEGVCRHSEQAKLNNVNPNFLSEEFVDYLSVTCD